MATITDRTSPESKLIERFRNMWPFVKKTSLEESGFFHGYTEMHCHLLPGVDDGVQTMEGSLVLLRKYEEIGIRKVWLTPHIMEDVPNETDFLRERFRELKAEYKGSIELHLAAENMMDNLFIQRLEKKDLLPIGERQNHLLVETSFFNPPMGLHEILQGIMSSGYFPLLAHPERYVYMKDREYEKLKNMGVRFQLNLGSIVGIYGPEVRFKAEKLLKRGMYDITGTDTHRMPMLMNIYELRKIKSPLLEKLDCLKIGKD